MSASEVMAAYAMAITARTRDSDADGEVTWRPRSVAPRSDLETRGVPRAGARKPCCRK